MLKIKQILLFFVVITNLISCTEETEQGVKSPEQKALLHPARPTTDRKEDELRRSRKVLEFTQIKTGMQVVDLGGGAGFYSELFSKLVGDSGRVYLQNGLRYLAKNKELVDLRLEDNRLVNVIRIDSSYKDMQLPGNVDIVFISMDYHDVYVTRGNKDWNPDVDSYIAQIYHSLKDDGRLIVLDHSAKIGSGFTSTKTLHRIDEEFTRNEIEKRGFNLISSSDVLRNPKDNRESKVLKDRVRGRTDKFLFEFKKKSNNNK